MTAPELAAPPTDTARDELIVLVVQYRLQFYYYAMEFPALECRLRQVTGGLTDANRALLARIAADLAERHSAIFEDLEWPLPLRHVVNLYHRLDPAAAPDDTPSGPPDAIAETLTSQKA
jgi:hypothetical protein